MKTEQELSEVLFEQYRKLRARVGTPIPMRSIRQMAQRLSPPEEGLFKNVLNSLINQGYLEYDNEGQLRALILTEKGYKFIYGIDNTISPFEERMEETIVFSDIDIARVRSLENEYLKRIQGFDKANLSPAINAFDNWYRALLVLLSRYFDDSNADYKYIKEQDLSCNGYGREHIYSDIQARVAMLLDKIENQNLSPNNMKTALKENGVVPGSAKRIYQVFVSSTYNDLKEERLKAMTTIVECGHLPIGMEQFPAAPVEAFEYIKSLIDKADYYLLLLAGKYGSINESTGKSFTQMEYEYAKLKGVPIIFLTYKEPNKLPFDKCESDPKTRELLEAFRKEASSGRLRQTWEDLGDLAHKVRQSLEESIRLFPRTGWVRADEIQQLKENDAYHKRDREYLHELLSNFNTDLMDEFILKAPDYIDTRLVLACECWGYVLDASAFTLFDKELLEYVKAFYNSWEPFMFHSECYRDTAGPNVKRFEMPHEMGAQMAEKQRWYDEKVRQKPMLASNYKRFIEYVKDNYPEFNLRELSYRFLKDEQLV